MSQKIHPVPHLSNGPAFVPSRWFFYNGNARTLTMGVLAPLEMSGARDRPLEDRIDVEDPPPAPGALPASRSK
jgi:hypothetical protein